MRSDQVQVTLPPWLAEVIAGREVFPTLEDRMGLAVAQWTLTFIAQLLPEGPSGTVPTELDRVVLMFAAFLSVGTGLLFGLFPALYSTRPDLATTLKGSAGQPSAPG